MLLMQGLVTALQGGEGAGKQRAALLLWQMLHVPAAVGTSAVVASQCASSDALVPGISWALHAESSAAAGVVQALVHDNHRWAYDFWQVISLANMCIGRQFTNMWDLVTRGMRCAVYAVQHELRLSVPDVMT